MNRRSENFQTIHSKMGKQKKRDHQCDVQIVVKRVDEF
jgi:hypothetical protein